MRKNTSDSPEAPVASAPDPAPTPSTAAPAAPAGGGTAPAPTLVRKNSISNVR